MLHGHGLRERVLLGPEVAGGEPVLRVALCRRFRCTACEAVLLVVPRMVQARRRFSASAIALALALWGNERLTAERIRTRVSPDAFEEGGWRSLRRWTRAVASGALFPGYLTGGVTVGGKRLREVAGEVASWLAGFAPRTPQHEPLWHKAFYGGEHAG